MALISCPDCGRQVSDRAVACPDCGCPIATVSGNGSIRFYWANKKGDSIRQTKVIVDGEEIGILKCQDCGDVEVQYGTHEIELHQGKYKLIQESVTINNNNPIEIYCFKEKMGFTHVQLKRVDVKIPAGVTPRDLRAKHVPKCPTCGSPNIKKISLTSKIFAVEMIGLASGSIGKTFICKDCKCRW